MEDNFLYLLNSFVQRNHPQIHEGGWRQGNGKWNNDGGNHFLPSYSSFPSEILEYNFLAP